MIYLYSPLFYLFCFISLFLYKLDTHTITKNYVVTKYSSFRKLNKLVETKYRGIFLIVYHSFCIIFTSIWISFLQYINNNVRKIDRKTFEISYVINGKLYKLLIKPVGGPTPILLAHNQDGEDITDLLSSYLGPVNDFHNFPVTPKLLGHSKITIETSDCDTIEFTESDVLKLKTN